MTEYTNGSVVAYTVEPSQRWIAVVDNGNEQRPVLGWATVWVDHDPIEEEIDDWSKPPNTVVVPAVLTLMGQLYVLKPDTSYFLHYVRPHEWYSLVTKGRKVDLPAEGSDDTDGS
jgi:hypothetical protein